MELKRLKDAFKRTSGITYYMTQQCFYREVLGDGVPHKVAEVSPSNITQHVPFEDDDYSYSAMLNIVQVATKMG